MVQILGRLQALLVAKVGRGGETGEREETTEMREKGKGKEKENINCLHCSLAKEFKLDSIRSGREVWKEDRKAEAVYVLFKKYDIFFQHHIIFHSMATKASSDDMARVDANSTYCSHSQMIAIETPLSRNYLAFNTHSSEPFLVSLLWPVRWNDKLIRGKSNPSNPTLPQELAPHRPPHRPVVGSSSFPFSCKPV